MLPLSPQAELKGRAARNNTRFKIRCHTVINETIYSNASDNGAKYSYSVLIVTLTVAKAPSGEQKTWGATESDKTLYHSRPER